MAGKHLRPGTILLFHGGGNFGDIWPVHGQIRRKAIAMFPNQKCIILPQTIYYQKERNLLDEAAFYAKYPNVTICARDNKSFEILKNYFPNNPSLLVPDMAFCMDMKRYKRTHNPHGAVFVRRTDKEINNEVDYQHVPEDANVSDWLFLGNSKEYERQKDIVKWASRFDCRLGTDWKHKWLDLYWQNVLRPLNVNTAISFLDRYEQIYTTRMHAAILSVILGKEDITLFDNSYGKSSSFFNTWLSDVEGVCLVKS
jgi:pyruvyl transferase EpsO